MLVAHVNIERKNCAQKHRSISQRETRMSAIGATLSCGDGNASNMMKHLSAQHGIQDQECGVLGRFCASVANAAATAAPSSTVLSFNSGSFRGKKCGGRLDDGGRTTIHDDVFLFSAGHCRP